MLFRSDGILLVVSCFVLCNVHEILSELIIKRELFVVDLTDFVLAVCRDIVVTSVVSEEDISESCNCRQPYFWVLPFDLHLPIFQGKVQVQVDSVARSLKKSCLRSVAMSRMDRS